MVEVMEFIQHLNKLKTTSALKLKLNINFHMECISTVLSPIKSVTWILEEVQWNIVLGMMFPDMTSESDSATSLT